MIPEVDPVIGIVFADIEPLHRDIVLATIHGICYVGRLRWKNPVETGSRQIIERSGQFPVPNDAHLPKILRGFLQIPLSLVVLS